VNRLLYLTVTLIWGTTWLAISRQAGIVPPLAAVFYRFLTASAVMLLICLARREFRRIDERELLLSLVQGFCLYSVNFLCFYRGAEYISGGMESLIFSLALFFNTLWDRVVFGKPLVKGFLPAFMAGTAGLVLLLAGDGAGGGENLFRGVLLCLGGTFSFSLGNLAGSARRDRSLSPFLTGFVGMVWGTAFLGGLMAVRGVSFAMPVRADFLIPLLFLAVPGSVVAFTAYLTLVRNMGMQRAAYINTITPLVAFLLSLVFEGERLTPARGLGAALILWGSRFLLSRRARSGEPLAREGESP